MNMITHWCSNLPFSLFHWSVLYINVSLISCIFNECFLGVFLTTSLCTCLINFGSTNILEYYHNNYCIIQCVSISTIQRDIKVANSYSVPAVKFSLHSFLSGFRSVCQIFTVFLYSSKMNKRVILLPLLNHCLNPSLYINSGCLIISSISGKLFETSKILDASHDKLYQKQWDSI